MRIKTFHGFEDIYPVKVEDSDSWYYGYWTPCSEAYEVPDFQNGYPGTRLYFFHYPSGKVLQPMKQEKNVFLERPVYEQKDNSFGIIRYDFNKQLIQALVFKPDKSSVEMLTELPFSKVEDLENIRLIVSPFALVKHDVQNDAVQFLWPEEKCYQFEENESLDFQENGKLYLSKWMEDPAYREEIIVRDAQTGEILERSPGYLLRMPDGSKWMMTK